MIKFNDFVFFVASGRAAVSFLLGGQHGNVYARAVGVQDNDIKSNTTSEDELVIEDVIDATLQQVNIFSAQLTFFAS